MRKSTYVSDKSVEWSVCLFVCFDLCHRKKGNRKRNETKRKHWKLFYEKWHKKSLEWEIKSIFGHFNKSYQRHWKRNKTFVCVCDKQIDKTISTQHTSDINRSIVVLDNFWFRGKQGYRIQFYWWTQCDKSFLVLRGHWFMFVPVLFCVFVYIFINNCETNWNCWLCK